MRGDRPLPDGTDRDAILFTPHARGSTLDLREVSVYHFVYPACAGIDPCPECGALIEVRLPRMRGDRPWVYVVYVV